MNIKNQESEIDLILIGRILYKNKLKLILIVTIGIILSIIHEINKKPFTPIYEISAKFESISLIEEQKYSELNNILKSTHESSYLMSVIKNSTKIQNFNNSDLFSINSKYLLSLFSLFFERNFELLDNFKNIKSIKINPIPLIKSEIGKIQNHAIEIKLVSNDGDLKTWTQFFQNQTEITNEEVRIYLKNKFNTDQINLKNDHNNLIEAYSAVNLIEPVLDIDKLDLLLNKLTDNRSLYINNSPINDSKNFKASNFNDSNIKISVINVTKVLGIELKILISVILSLFGGAIFILIADSLKKRK